MSPVQASQTKVTEGLTAEEAASIRKARLAAADEAAKVLKTSSTTVPTTEEEECSVDDVECVDITRSPNFYARESRSLATTLPPIQKEAQASAPSNAHPSVKYQAEECDLEDIECYDITRSPNFATRESRSLSTTLPPINTGSPRESSPEVAQAQVSREHSAERAEEMRRAHLVIADEAAKALVSIYGEDKEECLLEDMDCWDITKTPNFSARESQSLSTTLPPVNSKKAYSGVAKQVAESLDSLQMAEGRTVEAAVDEADADDTLPVDMAAHIPETRPQMTWGVSSGSRNRGMPSGSKSNTPGATSLDVSRFSNDRPSTLVNTGPKKRDAVTTGSTSLDVSQFSGVRPSRLVNTGEKKREAITTEECVTNIAAQNFSRDRASLLGHLEPKEIQSSPIPSKRRNDNYLDISSNMSGVNFKRSRDVQLDEKNDQEHFDITIRQMPNMEEMRQSPDTEGPAQRETESLQSREDTDDLSKEEEVMFWLLERLPNLEEEVAVSYFNQLLGDGFDSLEILDEVLEKDLYFMTHEDKRALLRTLQPESGDETE